MRERTLGINLLQILASEQDVLGVCLELVLPDLVKKKKKRRLRFCASQAGVFTPSLFGRLLELHQVILSGEECLGVEVGGEE